MKLALPALPRCRFFLPGAAFAAAATLASAAETSFIPWSYTRPDLFPSAIVSSATVDWNGNEQLAEDQRSGRDSNPSGYNLPLYGSEHGWLGVELQNLAKGSEVEVNVAVDGVLKGARWKGVVAKTTPSGRVRILPHATWDYPALLKVRQQRPVNVTFQVAVNGQTLPEKISTCHLKSINDCMFTVFHDAKRQDCDDLSLLFAGYVNENHPYVDKILQEALALRLVSHFGGYQEGEEGVFKQVFAIWQVLQRHGIKYSSITETTPSKNVFAQSVRFLDQSMDNQQANCVDGSVLMASILTKIGIDASLVLVPGHCFLEFNADKAGTKRAGLETTLVGAADLTSIADIPSLTEDEWQAEHRASLDSFAKAIHIADARRKRDAAFLTAEKPGFMRIPIAEARKFGIMPLPFSSDD